MIRASLPAIACLFLAGCVTNNLSTQNAQMVPLGGGAVVPVRPQPPPPSMTPTARLATAKLVTVSKTTTGGASLMLASPQSLAADCTSLGKVTVKVTAPPDHGTVRIDDGLAFSNYVPGDPPYLCNAKKTPATLVSYQSAPGFSGQDVAVVQIFFPNGNAPTIRFDITVQ